MDVQRFLDNIRSSYFYREQVAHIENLPAREAAYEAVSHIRFDGMQYRRDIAGTPLQSGSART